MKHKKDTKQKFVKEDFPEELKNSNHGKGKNCSKCGAKKETKKMHGKFLCKECREEDSE